MTRRSFVLGLMTIARMRWVLYQWYADRYVPVRVLDDVPREVPWFSFGKQPTWDWGEYIAVAMRPWSYKESQAWFNRHYRVGQ